MASCYKIKRSNESRILYCASSVFILYQYIKLLSDIILNKSINLLLMFVLTSILLLFLFIVYLDRMFLFDNYIIIVFAPKLILVQYDKVKIIEDDCKSKKTYDYHFLEGYKPLCLKIRNKEYLFSTDDNENVIKIIKKKHNDIKTEK